MAPHLLLHGCRLAISQFADSVAPHLLLCGGRLGIARFADSVAHHLLLSGGRLAIAQLADSVGRQAPQGVVSTINNSWPTVGIFPRDSDFLKRL